ncbi:hypothetical protein SAMN06265784_102457 [Paraburkholderia susongensis]|uniref:Uncharacterized protein n=1 Tax=Paraburkholderia susongensis TaxID=1515439 RepID=A0A1X7JCM6_9BURK|nr:hypothetical protein [Paraburkholderia susongensis]SMG25673.1 hypothetical protein SAMN06265784_102457 [Paraburkholderia susongensis]
MATLARRVFKVVLFCGLFRLLLPYVHPYPVEWTESQSLAWLHAANRLDIRDPDDLFFWVTVAMNLIATTLAYVVIMRLWRHYRRRKKTIEG